MLQHRGSVCCRAVALAVLVAPFLAACGGDESATQPNKTSSASTATTGTPSDSPYKAGLRAAYLPVLDTLDRLSGQCNPVTRTELAPCRRRLEAFQTAVARLQRYVSNTPAPADAKAETQAVVAASQKMQGTWSQQAAYLRQGKIAAANGMGGLGKPLTTNLMAWISAVGILDLKLPGKSLPIPSG